MIQMLIPLLTTIGGRVAEHFFPSEADKAKRDEMQNALTVQLIQESQKIEQLAAEVVKTEAASQHWLAANWRPLTMLTFVSLICARWMGWTAPGMTESEYLSIYDLIKIGLGGYVVGRSAEKIVPAVAEILAKRKDHG